MRALPVLLTLSFIALCASPAARASESLAREMTHLNSLKEGLRRETENLKRADKVQMQALETELNKLEQTRNRLAMELDKEESELQVLQQKMKVSGAVGVVDSATRELKREVAAFGERQEKSLKAKKESGGLETALSRFLETLEEAREILKRSGELRDEARGFSLVDGEFVQGRVRWIGETAAVGIANGKMAPLSPDGKGGWIAMRPLQETLSSYVVFSKLDERIDSGVSATFGDRALGLVPLVWLGLLGVAVTWLFALIAKN